MNSVDTRGPDDTLRNKLTRATDDEETLTLNGGRVSTGMHEDIDSFQI